MSENALEALEHVLEGGGEPDDVLRSTVSVLVQEPGITWAGHVNDISAVWAKSHIAALPSRREGLPKAGCYLSMCVN